MMQKAETGLLDTKKETEKPILTRLVDISVDEKKMIYVNWNIDKKEQTLVALAEAVKLVATYKKPLVEEVKRPTFIEGTRNFLMGRKT